MSKGTAALLFLAWFGVFGFFAHGYLENTDSQITLHAARAWYLRGDPGFVAAADVERLIPGEPSWHADRLIARLISDPTLELGEYGRTGPSGRHYTWFPIGHQALFVPCVALGEWLAELWPEPERTFFALAPQPAWGEFFWARFVASFVSPAFAAASVVVLLALARELGASPRTALVVVTSVVCATQFLPGTSETMSNVPGAFFFHACALLIVRFVQHHGSAAFDLAGAGACAGFAVLLRYPIALSLMPLGVLAAVTAFRSRRLPAIGWLVLGGLPALIALLVANHWRFGSVTETGYSGQAAFGSMNPLIGAAGILFSPGKGVFWFSPPVFVAVWLLVMRRGWRDGLGAAALASCLAPIAVVASVWYWGAGQCWGVRYLTAPLALLLVVVFAGHADWLRRNVRIAAAVGVLGLIVSVGGLIAPYIGHQSFVYATVRAVHDATHDEPLPAFGGEDDQIANWRPEYSPLHGHWTYARLSASGRIGTGRSEDTTVPLFGIEIPDERVPVPPPTAQGFRHVWWRALPLWIAGFPSALAASIWLLLTAAFGFVAVGRFVRTPP